MGLASRGAASGDLIMTKCHYSNIKKIRSLISLDDTIKSQVRSTKDEGNDQ